MDGWIWNTFVDNLKLANALSRLSNKTKNVRFTAFGNGRHVVASAVVLFRAVRRINLNHMETGLRSLRTIKPVMTPTAKLITFLLDHISMANADLNDGKPNNARAQLEYALLFANETLADNPEIGRAFYVVEIQAAICQNCGLPLTEGESQTCDGCK